jgi:TetR/AcrR family transcriptional regulator, transcriptional repressor for nem operon
MSDTKSKLLDAAALLVQTRGYNGFSFHDLADAVGIRTASIHYHFPTKGDLGEALVNRYTANFLAVLGAPDIEPPDARLRHYISLFRQTLADGRMCLCGIVGAEVGGLPETMGHPVRAFFAANEIWLTVVFQRNGWTTAAAMGRARLALSALEGAMLIARTERDHAKFEDVAEHVLGLLKSPS